MLEVTGLAKSFGKQVAVADLSFRVEAGEVVGLVGANGAGKTTTLLAVAGVLRPDRRRGADRGHRAGGAAGGGEADAGLRAG